MMMKILLLVFYLSGWNIPTCCFPRQYHYVPDSKNWTEAQTYCRQTYTDLATIDNSEELKQFLNISTAGYSSSVWIGLYSKVNWRWSDGYNGNGAQYRKWARAQPDFYSASQYCVNAANSGLWWDDDCTVAYPFICSKETKLNLEFVIISERMSWFRAQRFCRNNFTDLATVKNDTDNLELQNLVPSGDWAWTGLFRDPDLYWSDQSNFLFSYWDSVKNWFDSESVICGAASLQRAGKWRILGCETKLPFVCHSSPTPVKKQVVKLRMKLKDSVDINDPAVKAGVLKELQGSLIRKGVSGVTLKWREQPDGKVFLKEGGRTPAP